MTLDTELLAVERAFHRARARMDELERPFSFPANCCPSCACGPEWNALADKRERQAFVLARLLVKRDQPGDRAAADALFCDYGSRNLEWKAWRDRK